jgi:hypothetical protein
MQVLLVHVIKLLQGCHHVTFNDIPTILEEATNVGINVGSFFKNPEPILEEATNDIPTILEVANVAIMSCLMLLVVDWILLLPHSHGSSMQICSASVAPQPDGVSNRIGIRGRRDKQLGKKIPVRKNLSEKKLSFLLYFSCLSREERLINMPLPYMSFPIPFLSHFLLSLFTR